MYFIDLLKKNPLFVLQCAIRFFSPSFSVSPLFFSDEELFLALREKRKSYIRIGDGEMVIMLGGSIFYQSAEKELQESFWAMVREYSDQSSYILGVTEVNFRANSYLRKIGRIRIALPMKVMFSKYFSKMMSYADAAMFYKKMYTPWLARLAQGKDLIVIANDDVVSFLHYDFFSDVKSLSIISCPSVNAFASKEEICKQVDAYLSTKPKEDSIIYVAAGPFSKYLVFEYAKKGIQGIDIGLGMELISTHFGEDYSYKL